MLRRDSGLRRRIKCLNVPCRSTCFTNAVSVIAEGTARLKPWKKSFGFAIAVVGIGQMIHDADLLDDRFGRKEGYGVDEILKGWAPPRALQTRSFWTVEWKLIEGLYHSPAKLNPR